MFESQETMDRDVLMTRVIDGHATAEDWVAFRRLADDEPDTWNELAQTQSMHSALCSAMDEAIVAAEFTDVPMRGHDVFYRRGHLAGTWGGWLIAASVLIAWSLNLPMQGPVLTATSGMSPNLGAGYVKVDEPADALRAYVDRGRKDGSVVGLVPDVRVLETRAATDGSGRLEVLLVRQIIERQRVDQVYQWTQDESGRLRPIQVQVRTVSDRPF